MRFLVGSIAAIALLTGCQATTRDGPTTLAKLAASSQNATIANGADGLIAGHRLMATGDYEKALSAYMRAAGKQGLNADVLSALGSANLKLGRLTEAKRLLESAVEKDPKFVPAWNNLGVVLMEMGKEGEARGVFRNAFALDNGNSDEIRKNLRLAIAMTKVPDYAGGNENKFELVRRGSGHYLLLPTPVSNVEQ